MAKHKQTITKQKQIKIHDFSHAQERDTSFSLKLGNTNIEKIDDFNYLGLTVDTNLNWKKHTEKVANRCSKKLVS